eukprot:4487838-Pleurochrysis_carterae.AAC.2
MSSHNGDEPDPPETRVFLLQSNSPRVSQSVEITRVILVRVQAASCTRTRHGTCTHSLWDLDAVSAATAAKHQWLKQRIVVLGGTRASASPNVDVDRWPRVDQRPFASAVSACLAGLNVVPAVWLRSVLSTHGQGEHGVVLCACVHEEDSGALVGRERRRGVGDGAGAVSGDLGRFEQSRDTEGRHLATEMPARSGNRASRYEGDTVAAGLEEAGGYGCGEGIVCGDSGAYE